MKKDDVVIGQRHFATEFEAREFCFEWLLGSALGTYTKTERKDDQYVVTLWQDRENWEQQNFPKGE